MERVIATAGRKVRQVNLTADFVVAGGGLAGTCAAIAAAREGLKTILVQDRPVLGGNASSEVRLWGLGATSHMGNNNRWAREGGIIDQIMSENLWRNPEGNPVIFDAVLLDAVWNEPNLTVLLDTVVHDLEKKGDEIRSIRAYSSPEAASYLISSPLFCDATGDGVLGFLAGAAFRIGAEDAGEFNEPLAPDQDYGELLGTTIYFYSKDAGKPVTFVAPDFALKDITEIPRFERVSPAEHGCSFWWLEYGGRLDTIKDAAVIKRELLRVVYGIWDHIKNSGHFPEAENLTLEWVGKVPGKRESRRFEGDYMLTQADITGQRRHEDAVSFGGWAIDLHPADGVYSDRPPCNQYHARGIYQIPYRCLYSRDVKNLFLAGRLISASHVAFGSTRVMMTGGNNGQAVGVAAALCSEQALKPGDLASGSLLEKFQVRLARMGQFIPHLVREDSEDLVPDARISASAPISVGELPDSGTSHALENPEGMLLPFPAGPLPALGIRLASEENAVLTFQLRRSEYYGNFSPDTVIECRDIPVAAGFDGTLEVRFDSVLEKPEYLTVVVLPCDGVRIRECTERRPGMLLLHHGANEKVAASALQETPAEWNLPRLEFWLPRRRPDDRLWAMTFDPPLAPYRSEYLKSGFDRPFIESNSWSFDSSAAGDAEVTFRWDEVKNLKRIILFMDADFDHPLESVQYGHPDRVSPFLPRRLEVLDSSGRTVAAASDIHTARWEHRFEAPLETDTLTLRFPELHGTAMALYRVRAYT